MLVRVRLNSLGSRTTSAIFKTARRAALTAASVGKASANSGSRSTRFVPARYRVTYLPRTPPFIDAKSYSARMWLADFPIISLHRTFVRDVSLPNRAQSQLTPSYALHKQIYIISQFEEYNAALACPIQEIASAGDEIQTLLQECATLHWRTPILAVGSPWPGQARALRAILGHPGRTAWRLK